MKKLFIVLVVATAAQLTSLSGMRRTKKIFPTKKEPEIKTKTVTANNKKQPKEREYESDIFGTLVLLGPPLSSDEPVSAHELLLIAEEKPKKHTQNPLLRTICKNPSKNKTKQRRRKRELVFQISGLPSSGKMDFNDFEKIYG